MTEDPTHPHRTWQEGSVRDVATHLPAYRSKLRDYCCSRVVESPGSARNLTQVLDPFHIKGTSYPYYGG